MRYPVSLSSEKEGLYNTCIQHSVVQLVCWWLCTDRSVPGRQLSCFNRQSGSSHQLQREPLLLASLISVLDSSGVPKPDSCWFRILPNDKQKHCGSIDDHVNPPGHAEECHEGFGSVGRIFGSASGPPASHRPQQERSPRTPSGPQPASSWKVEESQDWSAGL